jgi:hypothetical protein
MRTRDRLASELRKVAAQATPANAARYEAFAKRAETGEFDDYADTYDCPITQLYGELSAAGFTKFAARVANGEFDATNEESDEWARSPAGQEAIKQLSPSHAELGGMNKPLKKAGRLALRVEDSLWCAYYAPPGTMNGALFLGSIQMRFVEDKRRKAAFMTLMQEAVSDVIEEITGHRPEWPNPPTPAPEHEKR